MWFAMEREGGSDAVQKSRAAGRICIREWIFTVQQARPKTDTACWRMTSLRDMGGLRGARACMYRRPPRLQRGIPGRAPPKVAPGGTYLSTPSFAGQAGVRAARMGSSYYCCC